MPKFGNFGQIWLNFEVKKVIFWLCHNVPIRVLVVCLFVVLKCELICKYITNLFNPHFVI